MNIIKPKIVIIIQYNTFFYYVSNINTKRHEYFKIQLICFVVVSS